MKKLLCLAVVLMIALSAFSPLTVLAEAGKTKLTILYWDSTDLGENAIPYIWFMHAYNQWEKKDSVELELLPQTGKSNDMFTKACLMMQSAETAPDIYMDDSFQAVSDADAGYLLDLTEYLNAWPTWTDGSYYEASKPMVIPENGKVYGVPIETDARGIWMNMDILDDAGLGRDWEPATWQELLDGLYQIKEKCPDIIPIWFKALGNSEGTTVNNFLQLLLGTDSGLYDRENGKWNIYSKGMIDTYTFYSTIVKDGLTGPVSELCSTGSDTTGCQYMKDGKCCMQIGGSFVANAQYAPGKTYEWNGYQDILKFVAMPTQNGQGKGHITISGGYALTVPTLSDQTDLAVEFIKEVMDDVEGLCDRVVNNGSLSCRDISKAPNYSKYTERPFIELATSFLEWTNYRPQVGTYSTVSGYLSSTLEAVVCGEDPVTAVETLYNDVVNALGAEYVEKTVE